MLQVVILNLNTDPINLIVVFLIICDISPAPAKALPLSSTRMHSMFVMLNLPGMSSKKTIFCDRMQLNTADPQGLPIDDQLH